MNTFPLRPALERFTGKRYPDWIGPQSRSLFLNIFVRSERAVAAAPASRVFRIAGYSIRRAAVDGAKIGPATRISLLHMSFF